MNGDPKDGQCISASLRYEAAIERDFEYKLHKRLHQKEVRCRRAAML